MKRYFDLLRGDPVWSKVVDYGIVIFLIRLADALISFWAPELIQSSLGSALYMGLIISFQSIVGLTADLVFPIFLKKGSVKKLTILAMFLSGLTVICLYISALRPIILFFLVAMVLWGVYYELGGFSVFQFVDNTSSLERRSGVWAILGIFSSSAYLLGPLAAVFILTKGNVLLVCGVLGLLLVAFLLFTLKRKMYDRPIEASFDGVKPIRELGYWKELVPSLWQVIAISFLITIIDATFWTTGVVWTVKLVRLNPIGSLLLPLYQVSTIFMGLLVAKWGIYKGKKKKALRGLILAGLFLGGLGIINSIFVVLVIVLISSIFLSISIPLIDGVYSDYIARMGGERKHLIGLNAAVVNMSYIIWPPIAGLLAGSVGEKMTFAYTGIIVFVGAIVLYLVMPRKLKLPASAMEKWEE